MELPDAAGTGMPRIVSPSPRGDTDFSPSCAVERHDKAPEKRLIVFAVLLEEACQFKSKTPPKPERTLGLRVSPRWRTRRRRTGNIVADRKERGKRVAVSL